MSRRVSESETAARTCENRPRRCLDRPTPVGSRSSLERPACGVERHPFIEDFCSACKPADRRPPWQWCEEHVRVDETSPLPGRWRSDASPWVRSVMDDFANNAIRDIAVECAALSAKNQTVMDCARSAIAEAPARRFRNQFPSPPPVGSHLALAAGRRLRSGAPRCDPRRRRHPDRSGGSARVKACSRCGA